MANKRALWNLHVLATTYHCRPSALIAIDDEWAAYQFDLAALHLAQHVEERLSRNEALRTILGDGAKQPGRMAGGFASVQQLGARRMQVPPDGIW